MKFIDLSVLFEPDTLSDIPIMRPHFQYSDHETGASEMMKTYGCAREDLPPGGCCADTRISCVDHSGTHMDAPWHYAPTMNGGERARTIDEMPMEWCMGNGVCLHFQDKPDGYKVTAADLEAYFKSIDYQPKPLDIVLLHTGAQKNYGRPEYGVTGCGVGREATLWLLRQVSRWWGPTPGAGMSPCRWWQRSLPGRRTPPSSGRGTWRAWRWSTTRWRR